MQKQPINHSPDLIKLVETGFQIDVSEGGGHLLVHHIPYLNSQKELKYGSLVDRLNLATPLLTGQPYDHTIYLAGETTYNADGTAIPVNNSNPVILENYISVHHYFSRKPPQGNYANYYDKIKTYVEIFESQAKVIHPYATSTPNRINETNEK